MSTQQPEVPEISNPRYRPGDCYCKPSSVAARFNRSLAWVWGQVKNDPQFPKPVYNPKNGMCFFIERELNDFAARFVDQSSGRANRARMGRERIAA